MIVHIISSLGRGGREKQLATIYANSDKERFPTKIIYFNEGDTDYLEKYNLLSGCIRISAKGIFGRLSALNRIMKRIQPDLLFSWGVMESFYALVYAKRYRCRFINGSIRHGVLPLKWTSILRFILLHFSKNIVANSKAGLKIYKLKRGHVLYNGIEKESFQGIHERERSRIKKEWLEINPSLPVIISVANLFPHKDYFTVLDSLVQVKQKGLDFYYIIIGDGPLRNSIVTRIKNLDLISNVKLVGRVYNVADYLKAADIFVHSSSGEGCSNAILEAIFSSLPVIVSHTGGNSEIVGEDYKFLFEYKNVDVLIERIVYLLEHPEERRKLGNKYRNLVQDRFSIERMMDHYYRVIESLTD